MEEPRRCSRKNGKGWYCPNQPLPGGQYCERCGTKERARDARRRHTEKRRASNKRADERRARSVPRKVSNLSAKHGWKGPIDLIEWARVLLDPMTRCHICGIRGDIRNVYRISGPWFRFLGSQWKRCLELGHRVPNVNVGGCVPLCPHCNRVMGKRILTLAVAREILRKVRADWGRVEQPSLLWWLHVEIDPLTLGGIGGLASMSPAKERRNERMQEALDERSQGVR